jgi:hypothetical protein
LVAALITLAFPTAAALLMGREIEQSWATVSLYPPQEGISPIAGTIVGVLGLLGVYVLPGLLWARAWGRGRWRWPEEFGGALLLSVVLVGLITTAIKVATGGELTRVHLIGAVLVVDVCGFLVLRRARVGPWRPRGAGPSLLVGLVFFALPLLPPVWDKLVVENFTGDGLEAFGFADSLSKDLVPTWDLENGTWGFYPHFVSHAYFNLPSLIVLGRCEAGVRWVSFLYMACAAMLVAALIDPARQWKGSLVPVVCGVGLYGLVGMSNSTYDPYFADLAELHGTDTLFIVLTLMSVRFLLVRRRGLFLLAGFAAATCQPSGPVAIALLICFTTMVLKGDWKRWGMVTLLAFVGLLAAYRGMVLVRSLSHPVGETQFSVRSFVFAHVPRSLGQLHGAQTLRSLWQFFIWGGVLPPLAWLALWRWERGAKAMALWSSAYLALVLISPQKHLHYLSPVVLFPLIVTLRAWFARSGRQRALPACVATMTILVGVLCLPASFSVNTAYREFGARTCMVFPSERDAVAEADMIYGVFGMPRSRSATKWGIGKHAWVHYSDLYTDPDGIDWGQYDFCFTESASPPDDRFVLVAPGRNSFLWARSMEMVYQQIALGIPENPGSPLLRFLDSVLQ